MLHDISPDESTMYDEDDEKENEIIVQNSINNSSNLNLSLNPVDEESPNKTNLCHGQNSINNNFNINSSYDPIDEVSPNKMNLSPVPYKSVTQTFHQLEECSQAVEEHSMKHKMSTCRKKSNVIKPGHMKYNAAKPTLESSDKLKFKSLSASQSLKTSDEMTIVETLGNVPECSNVNPVKDKQMAIYDISLDDSSYVAPPINQPRKGQIFQDHLSYQETQAPTFEPEVICAEEKKSVEESVECLNEPRGIMLRLGNGARTKPKDNSKSVRYSEDVTCTVTLDVAPTLTSKILDIRVAQSHIERAAPIPEVSKSEHEKVKATEGESAALSESDQLKSNENNVSDEVNERKSFSEEDFHLKNQQDTKTKTPDLMDSIDSRFDSQYSAIILSLRANILSFSRSSDGNPRKRRAASNVNYKEPSLNS